MRVYLLGGFLGAGKTTLARTLAARLRAAGERPVVITNDQGRLLVDTQLCRDAAIDAREIGGGCFCCRYPELEAALAAAAGEGATTAIAEAVGSCTDIVATVLAPLADRQAGTYDLAPFSVVVDPWRVADVASGSLAGDVAYLFRKQIEEADVVLLSRADISPHPPADVLTQIRAWQPHAPVLSVSGRSGAGIDEWLALERTRASDPLTIDYERYASAEAQLAWFNGVAAVRRNGEPLDAERIVHRFLEAISDAPVAHVKLSGVPPLACWGAVVRRGGVPVVDIARAAYADEMRLIVNARIAAEPSEVQRLLRSAMASAAGSGAVTWEDVECFTPSRPVPTHRYATRCVTTGDAACCAAFYQREDVLRLLGDSHHPGGVALTRRVARALGLGAGDAVLDVACGTGTSLRAVLADYAVTAIGLDARATPYRDERLELRTGDAHRMSLPDASVRAVLCECALSTFVDQPGALREMHRVLAPGGRVGISDMVLEGDVPDTLREWVHSGTCLQRAMSAEAYACALRDAGFRVIESWDASDALRELLRRIKRNLVGWMAAAASGTMSAPAFDTRSARDTLRDAERAVDAGVVRYGVFIAERAAQT